MEENYKTIDSLLAEVQSGNFFKDNPHLIDKSSIYRWVSMALKNLGRNVMEKKSKVVEIKNYRGQLDDDFAQLSLAVFCEKDKCIVNGNKDRLISTYFYTDRIESQYTVTAAGNSNDCSDCDDETRTEIIEKFYIHNDCDVTLTYKNPVYVKLGRDVLFDSCTSDCINRNIKDSPYSINIKGTTIYAQFKEGTLYIEYYGIPAVDGVPVIPHTQNGHLEEWLEYKIRLRLLEDAMWSKDATNLQGVFNYTVQKERELEGKAKMDTSPVSLKTFWDAIRARRNDLDKFKVRFS